MLAFIFPEFRYVNFAKDFVQSFLNSCLSGNGLGAAWSRLAMLFLRFGYWVLVTIAEEGVFQQSLFKNLKTAGMF